MRRILALITVLALVAACGEDAATTTTEGPLAATPSQATVSDTTTAPQPTPTTVPAPATTATTTAPPTTATDDDTPTTALPEEPKYTVAAYGHFPDAALTSSGALGSGCAPGTDTLPDGVWFGWVNDSDASAVDFDLACLWHGRLLPAASNDAAKLRSVPVDDDTLVYNATDQPIPYGVWGGDLRTTNNNAPGFPNTVPFWVFVNSGVATEMVEYHGPVYWAYRSSMWPNLVPGCCDAGDIAPASPSDPWPAEGWPADGFYSTWVQGRSRSSIEILMHKYLSCADYPETCPEWWTEENVFVDYDAEPLERLITFDRGLRVVVMPINSDVPLVGNGIVFREMLDDLDFSMETWIRSPETGVSWEEMKELSADPAFPFGDPTSGSEGYPIGYRGPGGAHLTYADDPAYLLGWTVMEIRNGEPILYIHAGLIAG